MSEQDFQDKEQSRPKYNPEYTERFRKAKEEAESKGFRYEHPNACGIGWKIHLNTPIDNSNPLTQSISEFLEQKRLAYKVGKNSGQEGKGMTIYIGDRDTMEGVAQELFDKFGERIPPAQGDTLKDDLPVVGMIWARFENTSDNIMNPPSNHIMNHQYQKYAQYGSSGVPYLTVDVINELWENQDNKLSKEEKIERSVVALTNHYGAFFTGTRNHKISIEPPWPSILPDWVKSRITK